MNYSIIGILTFIACCTFSTLQVSAHPGSGIFVDQLGQIYFTDTGEGIWMRETKGALRLLSGSALHWMAYSEEGHFANTPDKFEHFERITPRGSKPVLLIRSESPCTIGKDGNLYYVDTRRETRIISRTPDGMESEIAGGTGQTPIFRHITGMAPTGDNTLYVVDIDQDTGDHAILRIGRNGKVSTFASGFMNAYARKVTARGDACRGLVVDTRSNVFVAGTDRRCVVKITPQGNTSVALQATAPWFPTGVALFGDELYVLEYSDMPLGWNPEDRKGWVPRVRKVNRNGDAVVVVSVPRQDAVMRN